MRKPVLTAAILSPSASASAQTWDVNDGRRKAAPPSKTGCTVTFSSS
ncbi:hypothetical protein [Deinococcus radiophilus]|nr:hypothetical protein [Deinococcus radiophilus]UFA50831.1 hypothetical protein LMT64_02685 [Deinococcus radiophilus]